MSEKVQTINTYTRSMNTEVGVYVDLNDVINNLDKRHMVQDPEAFLAWYIDTLKGIRK